MNRFSVVLTLHNSKNNITTTRRITRSAPSKIVLEKTIREIYKSSDITIQSIKVSQLKTKGQ